MHSFSALFNRIFWLNPQIFQRNKFLCMKSPFHSNKVANQRKIDTSKTADTSFKTNYVKAK